MKTHVGYFLSPSLHLTKRQILDSSILKDFADDNFKFDENDRKLSKRMEKKCGERRNCS